MENDTNSTTKMPIPAPKLNKAWKRAYWYNSDTRFCSDLTIGNEGDTDWSDYRMWVDWISQEIESSLGMREYMAECKEKYEDIEDAKDAFNERYQDDNDNCYPYDEIVLEDDEDNSRRFSYDELTHIRSKIVLTNEKLMEMYYIPPDTSVTAFYEHEKESADHKLDNLSLLDFVREYGRNSLSVNDLEEMKPTDDARFFFVEGTENFSWEENQYCDALSDAKERAWEDGYHVMD